MEARRESDAPSLSDRLGRPHFDDGLRDAFHEAFQPFQFLCFAPLQLPRLEWSSGHAESGC